MKKLLPTLTLLLISFIPIYGQNFRWAQNPTCTTDDYARYIATDNQGSVYIIGEFTGTLVFKGTIPLAQRTLVAAGSHDIYVAKMDCSKNVLWANRIGGGQDEGGNFRYEGIKYDDRGSVYVTGAFAGTATLTTTAGSGQTVTSAGNNDIFLAKFDTSGVLNWSLSCGGTGDDEGLDVAITSTGDLIAAGLYTGTATFKTIGGSPVSLTGAGNIDIYIAKYSSAGAIQWANKAGGAGMDLATSVSIDKTGNLYIGGEFSCCGGGTATFGAKTISNASSWGGYIAKADANGNWLWANAMGASGIEGISRSIEDEQGNVYMVGHFQGNSFFTSSPPGSTINITSAGGYDVVIAAFDSMGVIKWAKSVGGPGEDYGWYISRNGPGNLLIAGSFSGTANFKNGITLTSNGGGDAYVVEIDRATGNALSGMAFGGTLDDVCYGIVSDNAGSSYVCGGFASNTITFGSNTLTSAGGYDSYVAKISFPTPFFIQASPGLIFCAGDSTFLFPALPQGNVTYQWLLNNAPIPGEVNDTLVVKTAGTFSLIATNSCNESDTSQSLSTSVTVLFANAGNDTTICKGSSAQLNGSGGGSYFWQPVTGLNSPIIPNPIATPAVTSTYVLKVSQGSCKSYDTVLVTVNNVMADAGTDVVICPNDSVQLHGAAGGLYHWSPLTDMTDSLTLDPYVKPLTSKYYYLTVSSGACAVTDSVMVNITPVTQVDAGLDVSICKGDSVQLNPGNGSGYHWTPPVAMSDTASETPKVSPPSTMNYIVRSGASGCFTYDTMKVTVNDPPVLSLSDATLCKDIPALINATASGADTYLWTPSTGLSDPTILQPQVQLTTPGSYTLTATNSLTGCKSTATVNFSIDPIQAAFLSDPKDGILPLKVQFTNKSIGGSTYLWVFDSSAVSTSTEISPQYVFTKEGGYRVMLVAISSNGCRDTAYDVIQILAGQKIFIPNSFTPNGDGNNDQFIISILNMGLLKELHGSIWNRWGEKIYDFYIPSGKWWDGSFLGKPCQQDVYFYIIDTEDIYGRIDNFHGTVTLLR